MFAHMEYDFVRRNIAFEVFRFEADNSIIFLLAGSRPSAVFFLSTSIN